MLQAAYSLPLVLASLFIASLASYTTLDLAGRISSLSSRRHRHAWLAGGALAMGFGIWCMHFLGMLSFSLPIPLGYDLGITALSLAIAVLVSYAALHLATRGNLRWRELVASGCAMGLGIAAMHYTGMAAMRMAPGIDYDPALLLLSVAIAMAAATAALWLASSRHLRQAGKIYRRRVGAALLMGAAIAGMHYTGMAAANFPLGSICTAASGISPNWLAVTIAVATFSILAITLVLSVLDARLEVRTNSFVQSLRKVNEELQHQATHDALTGLPNRLLLFERVQHAIDSAERTGGRFALFFIDLDGFKAINDSLGHAAGDGLLQGVAQRLKQCVRKDDIVARLGGDEFVVMVGGMPDAAMASHIGEKLFNCFRDAFDAGNGGLRVSPSIGIALFPDDGTSVDDLVSHADAAMYQVKTGGRNNYRFFEASMNAAARRAIEIQRGLAVAVTNGELFLQYQPKFDCGSGSILGAEALIRWRHPALGLVSPAEFIPIAERSGQIITVGQWVIEEVCRNLRSWDAVRPGAMRIAINLSQIQLRSPQVVEDILAITERHGVPPAMLMFEITETVAMQNAEETRRAIDRLQQAGFEMAIDDFGTGYSSLSYLQEFGVQQMKVDRSFIAKLTETAKGGAIVAAIIRLAHSLGMEVVAEGVETEAQLALLKELKCDQTQGYLLARPLNGADFVALLDRHAAGTVTAAAQLEA
ncbi:diguanylate cyclase/phosphodiesterase [Noviherbaspirillum humi]|uniref:Diguanylate cyclase/phosphodiesterase n=1 Tax=Noviherbaspirillum humi TaxID=1688639 RepID=A0A239LXU5_9BURK|nr:EAL domain-containing protein [Noviherbaspirillum humi]SNT34792.1 diguanylate cyclase/phosphodiesterase [Noviherbaspirillum humi]